MPKGKVYQTKSGKEATNQVKDYKNSYNAYDRGWKDGKSGNRKNESSIFDVFDISKSAKQSVFQNKVSYQAKFSGAESDKILMPELTNKPENQLTPFEKMGLAFIGISKKNLEQLKSKTTLDYDKFAKMLSTTKATLINKKGDEKFSVSLSEKILSVADVYSYGYEVFEDADKFNSWMLSPIRALGGKAPYEIMNNQFGREEVRNIIGRIAYGVFS